MLNNYLIKSNKKIFLFSLFLGFLSALLTSYIGVGYKIKVEATIDHQETTYFEGQDGLDFLPEIINKLHENYINKIESGNHRLHYFDCNARGYFTECAGVLYKNISLLSLYKDFELINIFNKKLEINFREELEISTKHVSYDDFIENINFLREKDAKHLYIKEIMPFKKLVIKPLPFFKKKYLDFFIYFKIFLLISIIFLVFSLMSYNICNKIFTKKV